MSMEIEFVEPTLELGEQLEEGDIRELPIVSIFVKSIDGVPIAEASNKAKWAAFPEVLDFLLGMTRAIANLRADSATDTPSDGASSRPSEESPPKS